MLKRCDRIVGLQEIGNNENSRLFQIKHHQAICTLYNTLLELTDIHRSQTKIVKIKTGIYRGRRKNHTWYNIKDGYLVVY